MKETRKNACGIDELRPLQEERFQRQMDLVFAGHPYYREVFSRQRLTRGDFRGLDDLVKLPLTRKEDYIARPEEFRLRLGQVEGISREERAIWDIIYTSGSTSDPTPFYDTSYDHYARVSQMKRTAEIAGIAEQDTVINMFPLTAVPHQGFLSVLWASQAVGARMVSGFGGSFDGGFGLIRRSREAIDLIGRHRVTVIWGIGFFLRRLILTAQEMGSDFSSVRLVLPMGEGSTAGMRDDLRRRMADMGARDIRVLNGYGFTEMQGPSMECSELGGFHLPKPSRYFFEILDPNTLERLPEGRPGLVVMTHLDRRGTCLLRYLVGDICTLTSEACPACGGWEPRFSSIPYRTGSIAKVKGTLVNIPVLLDLLSKIQGIQEYEIILTQTDPKDPFSEDVMQVKTACSQDRFPSIASEVRECVRRSQEVTPEVKWVPPDYYADAQMNYKFKRFKDERLRR
ncbi:MAG: AMP-binding protein [Thermodesulfobacteriota bacterium]